MKMSKILKQSQHRKIYISFNQSGDAAHIEIIGETWLKNIHQAENIENDKKKKNKESLGDAWFRKISDIETRSKKGGKYY